MARKLCRVALLVGLGVAAGQSWAQAPSSNSATVVAKAPAATAEETAAMGAIWAATADYVFASDPDLKPILIKLSPVTSAGTVERFKQELNKAVAVEGRKNKDSHVFMFQTKVFNPIQKQGLNNVNAVAAIQKALLDTHPERKDESKYKVFVSQISGLAAGNSAVANPAATAGASSETPVVEVSQTLAPGPAVPDPVPTDDLTAAETAPETTPVATPQATAPVALAGGGAPGWVSWLALALSLVGVALSYLRRPTASSQLVRDVEPTRPSRNSFDREKDLTDLVRKLVREELAKTEAKKPSVTSAASVAKTAAKPMPKASVSAAPVAPVPPAAVPAAPASEPDDFESLLAPLAAPTPRQYTQYANEAPFNNSFPARALSDQPGTYSMFAITSSEQQPEQGVFVVTGNLASHVRDHRSVLEPVCEYVSGYPLGSESRVVTVEPGLVRRRGDDWEVVQRAKVRFE